MMTSLFCIRKKILINYLKVSNLRNNKKIDYKFLKQCLNETIIFNHENNNIENLVDENKKIDLNKELNIINNFDYRINRIINLKRCSKCILPETYPFIKFDEKMFVIIVQIMRNKYFMVKETK